jgi:hypothetical protein
LARAGGWLGRLSRALQAVTGRRKTYVARLSEQNMNEIGRQLAAQLSRDDPLAGPTV